MRKNLVFITLMIFGCALSYARQLPDNEKQRIIAQLDSTDEDQDLKALGDIVKYNVAEAVPLIEEKIWQRYTGSWDVYLDALLYFQAPNLFRILRQMIDSSNVIGTRTFRIGTSQMPSGWNPVRIRVEATNYLFKLGDYSTARYAFEALRQQQSMLAYNRGFILLREVAQHVPEYRDSARSELIRIGRNASSGGNRGRAQSDLKEVFGQKVFPEIVYWARNDSDGANRLTALEALSTLGYPELRSFLLDRLTKEPFPSYKQDIVELLLTQFGGVEDYQIIKNYLLLETYTANRIIVEDALNGFKPPAPSTTTPVMVLLDSLISTTHQVASSNWIEDSGFNSELESDLQSARSYLVSGDSLNCAQQIKSFQFKVDKEFRDSLDGDARFVTIEGWKFLYYNAQYILDRLPTPTTLSPYSLFATHSLWLEQNAKVYSGDIGVNQAGDPPFLDSQVELSVGIGVTTASSSSIKAHRIKVKQGATVSGDVSYNELENNGTIVGTLHTPLPLSLVAALPEFKSATPGSLNIEVPQNGTQTLQPGSYGDIMVRRNGRLTFTGGIYHFNTITTGDDVFLLFQAPSEVRVAGKFDSGEGNTIGPEDSTSMSAREIVFYVGGINGSNGNLEATPKAAKIGIANRVNANFYVPNGTLWIRQNSEATGAFIGKDVNVGIGVKVWLRSAF